MSDNNSVTLQTWNLGEILSKELHIPDYQRTYCWSEENVRCLLDDTININGEYRLGTIILQEKNGLDDNKKTSYKYYDIIDGQQQLTTLALLIQIINDKKEQPPLKLGFYNRNNYVEQSDFINKYLSILILKTPDISRKIAVLTLRF